MRAQDRLRPFPVLLAVVALVAVCRLAPLSAQEPLPAGARQRVDAVFAAYDKTDSPGCALAIYRDGEIVYERGYGMASLEHGVAITPQTVFDIGSTSKQFTAFSILLLERQGKLSLDDDVRRFVPELPTYERPITIRHLMQHTSGLRDYLTLWSLAGVKTESWTTQQEAVQLVARQKGANFGAGDDWLYSNTGYLLLAEIVGRASGSNLRDFAPDRIFTPLGMRHTFYLTDHTLIIPRRATGYAPRDGDGFQIEMSDFEQIGDGGVQTTVEDLLFGDRNFYAPAVGDAALLERAQTVGRLNGGRVLDYAAGLTIGEYRGLRTVRHGGSWAGYRADLLRFPDQKTSVACLCNLGSANPSRLANQVADVVLEKILKPLDGPKPPATSPTVKPAVTLSAVQLAALAGVYRNTAEAGDYRRVFVRDGNLLVAPGGVELVPLAADRFQMARSGAQVIFTPAREGGLEMQIVPAASGGSARPATFRRLPPAPTVTLAEYAGKYYSDELDTSYTFAVRDGRLTVLMKGEAEQVLTAAAAEVFLHDGGLVFQFERTNGKVSGARVNAGRVRNLEFRREKPSSDL
jgi:CubicO group peptidase (beta-lactamase class C family)